MTNPAFTQVAFRIRNDNGDETTATWRQNQGVNDTIPFNGNFRVRFRLDETASRLWTNQTWSLNYQKNGAGGYSPVSTSTPIKYTDSAQYVEGTDCTAQLTGGTGTFVTDNNGMVESSGGAVNSGTAGYLFEVEFCLQIDPTQVSNADYLDLQVVCSSGHAITYSSVPRITASVRNIDKSDGVTVGDILSNIIVEIVPPGPISVEDGATVTDVVENVVVETLPVGPISVTDNATVGESKLLAEMYVVDEQDGVAVGEDKNVVRVDTGGETLAINVDYHYTGVRIG